MEAVEQLLSCAIQVTTKQILIGVSKYKKRR